MLYVLILLPVAAATIFLLRRNRLARWPVLLVQTGMLICSLLLFFQVMETGPVRLVLGGWLPPVGILLELDMLSAALQLLTCFLFLICFLLGLSEAFADNLFNFLFMTLQSLMLALFAARDLFTLSLVLEVSSLLVAILIMYKKDSRAIYDGLVYLMLNIAGMTFLLFGVALVYQRCGALDLDWVTEGLKRAGTRAAVLPFAFLFTGVLLKSAQLPVFFWLPKAHATPSAPSVVSAILSGLYINGGLYLFVRLREVFLPVLDPTPFFLAIGFATALFGVLGALFQNDLKGVLAYSTISQAGLIVAGLSLGTEEAWWGAIMHLFNHALYKSLLFLTAGIIIREYGTRDIHKIRGLASRMPVIAVATFTGMLGITGAPFLNGSVSKYYLMKGAQGWFVQGVLLVVNLGTMLVFAKYAEIFESASKPWKHIAVAESSTKKRKHIAVAESSTKKRKHIAVAQSSTKTRKHIAVAQSSTKKRKHIPAAESAAMLLLGFMCLLGGLMGQPLANRVFALSLPWDWGAYFNKIPIFLVSLLAAAFLWGGWLRRLSLVRKGYTLEPTFNGMAMMLALLFGLLLGAGTLLANG